MAPRASLSSLRRTCPSLLLVQMRLARRHPSHHPARLHRASRLPQHPRRLLRLLPHPLQRPLPARQDWRTSWLLGSEGSSVRRR